jgi:hypothetical protein
LSRGNPGPVFACRIPHKAGLLPKKQGITALFPGVNVGRGQGSLSRRTRVFKKTTNRAFIQYDNNAGKSSAEYFKLRVFEKRRRSCQLSETFLGAIFLLIISVN